MKTRATLAVSTLLVSLVLMPAAPALAAAARVPGTIVLVNPTTGEWHLRSLNGDVSTFFYGNPGDFPMMGDWDCDGVETPGLYRQSDGFVYLRNSNTQGIADIRFFFGNPDDIPLAGDFNGDGCDTVSIYRPSESRVFVINKLGENEGGLGAAEFDYLFGNPGDKPFVGDFDGDGIDTIGLHRESTGWVYFRQTHTQGIADAQFIFGDPGDRLVAGDWNGDGVDSPAIFRPSDAKLFFRYSNTQGVADYELAWGQSNWLPAAAGKLGVTAGEAIKVCLVTDAGAIDDRSFNETSWKGVTDAVARFGIAAAFRESQDSGDYRPNIDALIAEDCDLIVAVGFLLADDTAAAAKDNPDQKFAIVDFPVGPFPPWLIDENAGTFTTNVRGITFQTDEAAFLAGYLAAGMTQTGIVGTFGGINIPPVTIFMDGFVNGVNHHNATKGTAVPVFGWDVAAQDGLFTGNFVSLNDGRAFGQNLLDEGADILLPVAGPVGLGTAAVCQQTPGCLMIGVDLDQFFSAPDFADVWLTSIQKNMDLAVLNTVANLQFGGSLGDPFIGTLANGEVGLAPFHQFDDDVPAALKAELLVLRSHFR